jgi:hypothetical protein
MFKAEDIQDRLRKKPITPFRIIASEGLKYDIRHPHLVLVGRRDIMIGSPDAKTPTIFDRITYVALIHIVALEEIQPARGRKNGQP